MQTKPPPLSLLNMPTTTTTTTRVEQAHGSTTTVTTISSSSNLSSTAQEGTLSARSSDEKKTTTTLPTSSNITPSLPSTLSAPSSLANEGKKSPASLSSTGSVPILIVKPAPEGEDSSTLRSSLENTSTHRGSLDKNAVGLLHSYKERKYKYFKNKGTDEPLSGSPTNNSFLGSNPTLTSSPSSSSSKEETSAPDNHGLEQQSAILSRRRSNSFESLEENPRHQSFHKREKFQISGTEMIRKPSPQRSQSEDVRVAKEFPTVEIENDLRQQNMRTMSEQKAPYMELKINLKPQDGDHSPLQEENITPKNEDAPRSSLSLKKTFGVNWTPSVGSNNSKYKGIGNPEFQNTSNPAHAIKHSLKEFKKNLTDEVKKGVSNVKLAPSFLMVPKKKKTKPAVSSPEEDNIRSSIDQMDDNSFVDHKTQAIGEVYITNIQTRNLKSVQNYITLETSDSPTQGQLGMQKKVKSMLSLSGLAEQQPNNTEENVENTLYEDYVTYCEILCEGKKHKTLHLTGAYLNRKLKWGEEFKFYLSEESSSISVEVFHSSLKPKTKNEIICLGFVSIPLQKVKLAKDRILEDWFTLTTPLGTKLLSQVHLRIQYIPYQNPALSAKDLELLDNMSLEPNTYRSSTLKEKPFKKKVALLDALNLDVTSLDHTDYESELTEKDDIISDSFLRTDSMIPTHSSYNKLKEEVNSIENNIKTELDIVKEDLSDTKKKLRTFHENTTNQFSSRKKKMERLEGKVEKIEARVNHLSNIVLQLNTAHTITKDKVTSHDEDLKLYEGRIKDLENIVTTLQTQGASIKIKEWIFFFLAILLVFFSKIIVVSGYIYKRIKLRRPPTESEEDDDDDTFVKLRKRLEGTEERYRKMANKTTTPKTEDKGSGWLLGLLGAAGKIFSTKELDSKVETSPENTDKVTISAAQPPENMTAIRKITMDSSSDEENIGFVNSRSSKKPYLRPNFRKPTINPEEYSSDEEMEDLFLEARDTKESSQNTDMKPSSNMAHHHQNFLLNQLKGSFANKLEPSQEDEVKMISPSTQESSTTSSPATIGLGTENDDSKQQSIIEETEKLQSISRFFRKQSGASLQPPKPENKVVGEEEDDFDSWFNKINE